MDNNRRWWSYLLWILALGVGIGCGSGALSVLNSFDTLIKTSSMPADESIPIWSVPRPEFVLPILQTLRPWIVPNPNIEAIIEIDAMLWEDIHTLKVYRRLHRYRNDGTRGRTVPQPEFVLPILQSLGPWLVPTPDIETTTKLDDTVWENIRALREYALHLHMELQNRIDASEDDLLRQLYMDKAPPEIADEILHQKREEIRMLRETKQAEIRMLGETKRTEMEEWERLVRWEDVMIGYESFDCP